MGERKRRRERERERERERGGERKKEGNQLHYLIFILLKFVERKL